MLYLQSIILGLVEGVTEFLPVSSTFHLIVASKFLGIEQSDSQKLFEVVIQAGAILAVIWLYGRTLLQDKTLLKKVIISFIPTAIVGFLLYKIIKQFFFDNLVLEIIIFGIVGVVFIIVEKRRTVPTTPISTLTTSQAIIVGLSQAVAVIPGISRAGSVMIALLLMNKDRKEAAKYSFLLALPTIIGAAVLDLYKSRELLIHTNEWVSIIIGSVVSFFTALIIIKWFIKYLQTHTLSLFGWYRVIAAILLWWFVI